MLLSPGKMPGEIKNNSTSFTEPQVAVHSYLLDGWLIIGTWKWGGPSSFSLSLSLHVWERWNASIKQTQQIDMYIRLFYTTESCNINAHFRNFLPLPRSHCPVLVLGYFPISYWYLTVFLPFISSFDRSREGDKERVVRGGRMRVWWNMSGRELFQTSFSWPWRFRIRISWWLKGMERESKKGSVAFRPLLFAIKQVSSFRFLDYCSSICCISSELLRFLIVKTTYERTPLAFW